MLRTIARGSPGTLWRRIYSIASPAAGVDITVPVPAHKAWQLLSVSVKLTASAVAGNRLPALTFKDSDGVTTGIIASPTAITANLAPTFAWMPGIGAAVVVAASYGVLTLPDPCYMLPQESFTITGHTDPGDAWSLCRVQVLETNTGDPDYIQSIQRDVYDHAEALYELTR